MKRERIVLLVIVVRFWIHPFSFCQPPCASAQNAERFLPSNRADPRPTKQPSQPARPSRLPSSQAGLWRPPRSCTKRAVRTLHGNSCEEGRFPRKGLQLVGQKNGNRAGSTVSGLPTAHFEGAPGAGETCILLRGVGGEAGGGASPGEAGGVAIARDEISFFLQKSNRPLPGFVPD